MKHNELKSYIKNKIKKAVDDSGYDVVSIDETNSVKRFLIVDRETLLVQGLIRLFVNIEEFSLYYINAPHLKNSQRFNFFKDSDSTAEGYNTQLHIVNQFINVVKQYITELNVKDICK